jgi:hypothetical protein
LVVDARLAERHRELTGRWDCSQVGQGTANEVELLDLREELERKEEKYELEKGRKKDTAQGDTCSVCCVGLWGRELNGGWYFVVDRQAATTGGEQEDPALG